MDKDIKAFEEKTEIDKKNLIPVSSRYSVQEVLCCVPVRLTSHSVHYETRWIPAAEWNRLVKAGAMPPRVEKARIIEKRKESLKAAGREIRKEDITI